MILHGHLGTLASGLLSIAALAACVVVARGGAEAGQRLAETPRQPPGLDEEEAYFAGLIGGDEGAIEGATPRLRAVISRRDPHGAHVFHHECRGSGAMSEPRVAVEDGGGALVALTFEGAVDCGAGPIYAADEGDFDALVIAFDPLGRVRWTVHVAAPGAQAIAAVAIDPWGSALIAGSFEGTIDLGGAPMTAGSSRDALLAKLDADGKLVWQRHFGGGEPAFGVDVDVTRTGRSLLLARGRAPIDFGDGARQDPRATAFLAAFESDGRPAWSRGFVADGEIAASRARALPGNQILMSGTFSGAIDLGAGLVSSAGRSDAFVMRLDGEGHPLATARFGEIFASAPPAPGGADPPLTVRLRDLVDQLTQDASAPVDPSARLR